MVDSAATGAVDLKTFGAAASALASWPRVRGQRMPGHVEQRRGHVFSYVVTLIESSRTLNLVDQGLRHRLAGLIMLRVICEDREVKRPVFVYLRWKLDEVARDGAQQRITNMRKHRMQRVTKFMKDSGHIVKAQQRRLARMVW